MKLQYRGVSYDHNSKISVTNLGKVEGKFRGHKWTAHNLKPVDWVKPSAHLVYRGVEVR